MQLYLVPVGRLAYLQYAPSSLLASDDNHEKNLRSDLRKRTCNMHHRRHWRRTIYSYEKNLGPDLRK